MRRTALFITLALALCLAAHADRPTRKQSDWYELEEQLRDKGIQPDTESVLKAAQTNPDPWVRWVSVELLGRRKEFQAKGILGEILANDKDLLVRETAALALARLGDSGALKQVESFMQSSSDPTRQIFLASELAELEDFSGYRLVAKAARSKDESLRFASVRGLVRFLMADFRAAESVSQPQALLDQLLRDPSAKVRKETILQISMGMNSGLHVNEFAPEVERLSKEDPDPDVREEANLFVFYWKNSRGLETKP